MSGSNRNRHRRGSARFGHSEAVPILVFAGLVAACATSGALRQGKEAEDRRDYDRAVADYQRAVEERPSDPTAHAALDRARRLAGRDHLTRGRQLVATGKLSQAAVEFQLAAALDPGEEPERELREVRQKLAAARTEPAEKTELEALIERTRDLPAAGLELRESTALPPFLAFRDQSSRDVFTAIGRMAGLSMAFDRDFREAPVSIELGNASLNAALEAVTNATRTFIHVVSPAAVVVVPDTPAKRAEYAQEVVRTFYLSNADLKETMDMLRAVLDTRRMAATSGANTITIRDTPEHVAAAARIIAAVDKERPELMIDVELLEVDRSKLSEYGLQLASPGSAGINGQVGIVGAPQPVPVNPQSGITLDSSQVVFANLPALYYRLLKSDSSTRSLANPQLRTLDGLPVEVRFGDRVPVPTTTFTPVAAGGARAQPIASYSYEDIGVNVDLTPRTHHGGQVTLALKVEISALEGTAGVGGLPQFSSRQVNTTVDAPDGQTIVFSGLIRDSDMTLVEGVPGMAGLPGIGRLFGHTQKQATRTDVILLLTPHIIRPLQMTDLDLGAFAADRGTVPVTAAAAGPVSPVLRPPPSSAPGFATDLTGTWRGTLNALQGTLQMTWTLVQSSGVVTGSVDVEFLGAPLLSGTLSGTLSNGTLTYSIAVPAGGLSLAPACTGQLTGTATAVASTISGTATPAAATCTLPISTVSFALTKQ